MEIFKLYPIFKNYIWGGTRLLCEFGKQSEETPVAESWELSCHPEGSTKLADGRTLRDLDRSLWGENCRDFADFPMLIKLIDAAQNLSVQVHPDDVYALANEQSFGKTEMWYIVNAQPDAGIYLGFSHDVSEYEVRNAIAEGTLCSLMNFFPVKKGECYFIPSGTIHAIGAGCLICEVQQNSNITYRVFDYGRCDKNGNPRELHLEKALRVLNYQKFERTLPAVTRDGEEVLASCPYFHVTRLLVNGRKVINVGKESFLSLTCVEGFGRIHEHKIKAGDSFFLPAGCGELELDGQMEIICAKIKR